MARALYLVDGSNLVFRAFHAMPAAMRAPDGLPTGALMAFATTLRKLLDEHAPEYMAVAFESGPSFRRDLYAEYKAQRLEMPEDLRAQWPEFAPLCEEMGVRALDVEGLEADDIIGTLARRFGGPDLPVRIVSGDKDFDQLVDEWVHRLDPGRGRGALREIDPDEVLRKWGVPPARMVDLLALMGDSSDNVPGVPGVGPKKAAALLERYGDLDAVLAAAAEVRGKLGERLRAHADDARLARRLVEIRTDAELPVADLEALRVREPDLAALERRFQRYGFRRLLADVRERMGGARARRTGVDRAGYRIVRTAEELDALVRALREAGRFAFDSETTGLDPRHARVVGLSFCWADDSAVYVPVAHVGEDGRPVPDNCPGALDALLPLLADPSLEKVGQNLKYDLEVLRARGHDLAGIAGDAMLADYLLDPERRHGLDDLARDHLGHEPISYAEAAGDVDLEFARVPVERAAVYAAEDAHLAWLLHGLLVRRLEEEPALGRLYRDLEVPLVEVLAEMELAGIRLDVGALGRLSDELGRRMGRLVAEIHEEAGEPFNVNSTRQLAAILFDKRGLQPLRRTRTGRSTDAATLEKLAEQGDRLCRLVLDYRELAKLKGTYVDALPRHVADDGRVHTSFHQAVAATGRLASHDPNLQNIPVRTELGRRIRACFVPDEGFVFLSADYSQVELRVLAHLAGAGGLVEAFRAGEDVHRRTAAEVFGAAPALVTAEQRRAAKAINFGIIYGMGPHRLAGELGISRREAKAIIDRYFERYPEVRAFQERAVAEARETGYARTLFGRRRPIHGIASANRVEREQAERIAVNTPVQGTAADIIKRAMLRVHRRLRAEGLGARLLLQVHDELLLEVPEAELDAVRDLVVREMEEAAELAVPLVVDTGVGENWDEAH